MLDRMLAVQTRASPAVSAGLKKVNFEQIAVEGHSVERCKELIEQLVQSTRRVRTLQEVLTDIKDNLKKKTYTEIIHRATIKGDLPKRPPSAYLLYHNDRYNELREENPMAVEVSKIVAEEWKTLSDKRRAYYQNKYDELLRQYEEDMEHYGLIDDQAPKRPKSAKKLYVENRMAALKTDNWDRDRINKKRDEYGNKFDNLSAEEKQTWIQMHKECQMKYQEERAKYIADHPHLNHTTAERKARVSDKVKLPEPPKSAVKFFLQKKMPEDIAEGYEHDEFKKKLKAKFAKMSEKKQLKYIKKAIEDKERYDREIEQFKKEHPEKEIAKVKANVSSAQLKLYARVVENRPNPPAPTAYLHYCGKRMTEMMNDEDDTQAPTKRLQTASDAWNKCSENERRLAEQEYLEDVERYIREMDEWLASQPEDKKMQILTKIPRASPDYWRKKLQRMQKAEKKSQMKRDVRS